MATVHLPSPAVGFGRSECRAQPHDLPKLLCSGLSPSKPVPRLLPPVSTPTPSQDLALPPSPISPCVLPASPHSVADSFSSCGSPTTLLFLQEDQVYRIHRSLLIPRTLNGETLYRLATAVVFPIRAKQDGQGDVFKLAALLAQSIIFQRPFVRGNKSTALAAASTFLAINAGLTLAIPFGQQALADGHAQLEASRWSVDRLAALYMDLAEPVKVWTTSMSWFAEGAMEI